MQPNAETYNPDPTYLRELLTRADITQRGAAKVIGISERSFRDYLNSNTKSKAPYPVQFDLEMLAAKNHKVEEL